MTAQIEKLTDPIESVKPKKPGKLNGVICRLRPERPNPPYQQPKAVDPLTPPSIPILRIVE